MNQEKYNEQWQQFLEMSRADGRFDPREEDLYPILSDDGDQTIHISLDYLLHTSWAARQLARTRPKRHVDIGSFVYFAGLCSAFVPQFEFYDVRPINFPLDGLDCRSGDITALPLEADSVESLSCLHVMEHIGLGRYGDRLDAAGDLQAAAELARVLAPSGRLLMVLPMNEKPRVHFNAHRFYSMEQVRKMFSPLTMLEYSVIWREAVWSSVPLFDNYTACMVFTK